MIETIQFSVPAIPIAQPRQRHRNITTKTGKSFVHNYTPAKAPVNDFKAAVKMAAAQAYRGAPLDGPLSLGLLFVMPRPGNMRWKRKPMPRVPHVGKPDRDNLMKSFQDALNGLLWVDDSQIFTGWTEKWIASGDEQPHVEVQLTKVTT